MVFLGTCIPDGACGHHNTFEVFPGTYRAIELPTTHLPSGSEVVGMVTVFSLEKSIELKEEVERATLSHVPFQLRLILLDPVFCPYLSGRWLIQGRWEEVSYQRQ